MTRLFTGIAIATLMCCRALAVAPCCGITQIDPRTSIVAAKETATGRTFTFNVTDAKLLQSLRVGQPVYANFSTRQVSINGAAPCCNIVDISAATPVTPCCTIAGIDLRSATVTAKDAAAGKTFTFKVSSSTLLNSLKVGQQVYANYGTRQVSVNGAEPCCGILTESVTATAAPMYPCCEITSVDVRAGTITAKETATSRTFSFKVNTPALLNSLRVGQGVYANFGTRQVSLDGATPCCGIVGP